LKLTLSQYACAFLVLTGVLLPATAAPPQDPISVTFTIGWQNNCRDGEWTPMELVASSQIERPFIGQIEISLPQDRQHQMIIHHPLVLLGAQSVKIPLVVKMSSATDICRVRLIDRDGNVVCAQSYELYDFRRGQNGITIVPNADTLIVSCGRSGLSLPYSGQTNQFQGQFHTCKALPNSLPCAWTGYKGLDALILYDPDWSQLNPAQHQALAQWVANGGRLMIILGGKAIPAESPIAAMIPFTPGPPRKTPLTYHTLVQWSAPGDPTPGIAAWRLPREMPTGWNTLATDDANDPLIVAGPAGFGHITLSAFDLVHFAPADEAAALKFWNIHLESVLEPENRQVTQQENSQPAGPIGMRNPQMIPQWGQIDPGVNNVLGHLMSITELEPISIWWILLILGTMAVLIGPVDYIVLKRLDRLPWTYITFLTVLAVFTTGAYFGVQFLRAGKDQLRRVSVIDKIDGTNIVWQTGYTGIFASQSDDYLLTGFPGDSWWAGVTPSQSYYGGGSEIRNIIECGQQEGNVLLSLPVNIWSMRTLVAEQPGGDFPLSAQISLVDGRITAVLRNTGQTRIDSGTVRIKDMWWDFGTISPGQSITVQGLANQQGPTHPLWQQVINIPQRQYFTGEGGLQPWLVFLAAANEARTRGINSRAAAGQAVVYASTTDPADCPIKIKNKKPIIDNTTYLRLVVPTIKTGS